MNAPKDNYNTNKNTYLQELQTSYKLFQLYSSKSKKQKNKFDDYVFFLHTHDPEYYNLERLSDVTNLTKQRISQIIIREKKKGGVR
jgi:hypothetical protein